jgi:two-component system response regulator YesN
MNAAYASALFSQVVGVPFKTYLTELRLEKAKALLSDPSKTVSEVAYSTGYASENRFRLAFKKATGLPPTTWRATMHTSPLPASPESA